MVGLQVFREELCKRRNIFNQLNEIAFEKYKYLQMR
jgi:hypothetical protein